MSIFSAAILLFFVFDPLGNIPLFTCMLNKVERKKQKIIIIRELLIALAILIIFLFSGRHILNLLGISQSSLGMAGGIVLMMISIKMVFSSAEHIFENSGDGAPFIVPLAVPLIAGPSAITTVILLFAKEPSRWLQWLIALISAWLVSSIILIFSVRLSLLLGARVLKAIERLMGMILTAAAVEMFVNGVKQSFF